MGQIKHTKKEDKPRLSRKERERLAAEAAAMKKDPKLKDRLQSAGNGRGGTPVNGKAGVTKGKAVDVGYKGTMRPANVVEAPVYRGTMRAGNPGKAKEVPKPKRPGQQAPRRYVEEYSDEEEDEDEDEGDYDSASSDMEAGLDEIDREEFTSARVAKKEDEEAMKEEEALRQQKLERKKKLQALSAAAATKKKVY